MSCIGIGTVIDAHCIQGIITIMAFGDIPADTILYGITGTCGTQTIFCIGSTGNSIEGSHANAGRLGESFGATRAGINPGPICLAGYQAQPMAQAHCAD